MTALPWMPLYIADYLADTGHLSTVEHGAYMLLIMHYWQHEGLPDDERRLARIARLSPDEWQDVRDSLADLFDDGWKHGRIDRELQRTTEKIGAKSKAGLAGSEKRWKNREARKTRAQRLADARQKGRHTPDEWLAMQAIFGGCVACETPAEELHGGACLKDHIVPLYQGGSDGIDNIQPMCRNCNSRKGADTTDFRDLRVPDWRERLAKRLADGCVTPIHPQPHPQSAATQHCRAAEFEQLEGQLREAAGLEQASSPSLRDLSPIVKLIDQGYDLAVDIMPKLRAAKASGKRPGSWSYFVAAITEGKARNDAIPPKAQAPPVRAQTWVLREDPRWDSLSARSVAEEGKPLTVMTLRSKVGPGNYVPNEWLAH